MVSWWRQLPSSAGSRGRRQRRQALHRADQGAREICMKERAGNCEHRKLYHDRPLCALLQQTGSYRQGWVLGWQNLALTVDWCGRKCHSAYVGTRPCDTRDGCIAQRLEFRVSHRRPIPNLGEQKLPLLTQEGSLTAMKFQAAPVDRALGSIKRMCSSGHIGVRRRRLLRAEQDD